MTNYEWLIKNNEKLVKSILAQHISKEKGVPGRCPSTQCVNCDFNSSCHSTYTTCTDATEEWLEAEHQPLYQKGDIVITSYNQLAVVKKVDSGGNTIAISSYANCDSYISTIPITDIKKKVGHIDESEVEE